jgi:VanZ family protein
VKKLRLLKLWLVLGWALIGLLIYVSLSPSPPEMPSFTDSDKVFHVLAYMIIMFWFGCIYEMGKRYIRLGLILIIIGVVIEFIQEFTGYRSKEYYDMAANTAGVLFGWFLARTRLSWVLTTFEDLVMRTKA